MRTTQNQIKQQSPTPTFRPDIILGTLLSLLLLLGIGLRYPGVIDVQGSVGPVNGRITIDGR